MELQGDCKCAFCERSLESKKYGKIEQDVEHFRPKASVKNWPVPAALKKLGVAPTAVPAGAKGYHLLPHHLFNYAAACKPCNSVLKKDYFPIAGAYATDGSDPAALTAGEQPYLIYPIGQVDDDPETLIDFHGTSPRAVSPEPHKRN